MYPFSALVGQEEMRLALLLHAVDPGIGGVLIFGDRGTGKSTAVRALAHLLPPVQVIAGCRFHCDPDRPDEWCSECCERFAPGENPPRASIPTPLAELPLGTTEDRLLGGLDVEAALVSGRRVFAPGLLARAHRGFLYIDEVNLLDDHLVDLLLDAAAFGVNIVERDGISLRHPARFVLIGSGNPEEGDLRPQLRDRFGLSVHVATPDDVTLRVEILRRRLAYEEDPRQFQKTWAPEEERIRQRIGAARERLAGIPLGSDALTAAAAAAARLGLQGHRGELTTLRAAKALAAWEAAPAVTAEHVLRVSLPAFRHRLPHPIPDERLRDEIREAVPRSLHPAGEAAMQEVPVG